VGVEKRRSFRNDEYWARGVPGFGDGGGRVLILGLAPAAHGANRTGRVFTGDRSGEWLFAALHRAGLGSQPRSISRLDDLTLLDTYVTAAVKCAPPDNKPMPDERSNCERFLMAELDVLDRLRVIVCLGGFAWDQAIRVLGRRGLEIPRPRPRFGHAAMAKVGGLALIGSYHPSQQNTFTGRLTEPMFDQVFELARSVLSVDSEIRGG
jgi:uracil-DNA glycosylase family 4